MKKLNPIRTRFAPSPTGFLHIGGLRTALYSYLFAKQNSGQFVLRLEDTDINRYVEGAAEKIYEGLKWAGLQYDEGPDIGGPYGPYVQSKRLDLYKKYAQELINKRSAYYCFCSDETLEQMRQEQTARKQAPKYDRRCCTLDKNEIQKKLKTNEPYTIRMKIPEGRKIEVDDIVRGKIVYKSDELDDQVILKSDGYPTYHLAVVVDDHLMQISHVTRTEEWLPSTPKHILLYEYFGWETPKWAHLPLLLNTDKTKMSKRKGDVALEEYTHKGYLPQAMVNYLAFLGWNPGTEKEIYSMEELLKDFDLKKVHKAGAIFNVEKLNWYNQYYIRQIDLDKLTQECLPYIIENGSITPRFDHGFDLGAFKGPFVVKEFEICQSKEKISFDYIKKIVALEKERIGTLAEMGDNTKFFFELPDYEKGLLKWKQMTDEEIKKSLSDSKKIISEIPDGKFNLENIKNELLEQAKLYKDRGVLLWPLRVALSGQKNSPPPFEIAQILGKNKSLERIEKAIKLL
jgi:glutamyl-tRNA synthetase